jgi:hypothetical protein
MDNVWTNLASKFNKIDVYEIVREILRDLEGVILDTNRGDQLYISGQLSDGSFLPPYKSSTVAYKVATPNVDKRIENMTLRDKGDFYSGFTLTVTDTEVIITSTDEKTGELTQRYGREIFGLTNENWDDLAESNIVPNLILKINNSII